MGLGPQPKITPDIEQRSYITVIRRNWHLLPYDQLLQLLGWSEKQLAYALREDDFLYVKLGMLKPKCDPLKYEQPNETALKWEETIAKSVRNAFPDGVDKTKTPLFSFVRELSAPVEAGLATSKPESGFSPKFCFSYFALYGDSLLASDEEGPYPDGYLARLAASGADGVWLQAVLFTLAPTPWETEPDPDRATRLEHLKRLVDRAGRYGIKIYLYLNEPRAMPTPFFDTHPDLRGVGEGEYTALCTSSPVVQKYITDAVETVCKAAPGLGGFFTITASENLTNCWSHHTGQNCPRCAQRSPGEVLAEVNALIQRGIDAAGSDARLIAWDWGWKDEWIEPGIKALPEKVSVMSVSEWSIPITRGGVNGVVGEYSISTVGPGPRAQKSWDLARGRGMKAIAKIQANVTWELSSIPHIPAVENVARHAANLRDAKVDGLMLGWTLGGHPSPNLEVVSELGKKVPEGQTPPTAEQAMDTVARRLFGDEVAPKVVQAWRSFSTAFSEYPYNPSLLYVAPMQYGPANPLWGTPTHYAATMVGIPYDNLSQWCASYPPDVFIGQFNKMADGFEEALKVLRSGVSSEALNGQSPQSRALREEMRYAEVAAINFRSTANQARFVIARDALANAKTKQEAEPLLSELEALIADESKLAERLYALQSEDSRIGFESSNQYFFIPIDLVEKVVNCDYLRDTWLPAQRARLN
ncbi:MAG: hypothetical protein K1Y02_02430 [Candidatus Hydrogenedentes bacterium]|nr:hypothetical protein [Candidatus Hydrogenedentota bacterium]